MKKIVLLILMLITSGLSATALTNVSGGIYTNTTWTLANSPYIVTDTVVVFPGVTLTIEPGVVVKFDNKVQLEIRQATIIAHGTATDSITFTANSTTPSLGFWDGIYLNQCPDSIKFYYCNIKYSDNGINGSSLTFIFNSNFSYNNDGAYSSTKFYYSCIFNNNKYGINDGAALIYSCKFTNNQIAMQVSSLCLIENCLISLNQSGIIGNGDVVRIKNCTIDSNTVIGINLIFGNFADSIYNCQLRNNHIGIEINGGVYVIQNDIEFNEIGIKVDYIEDTLECNTFCNNTIYDLYYNATQSSNSNFPNNYWCTPDSGIIESHIFDGYDNVNKGLVFFMPPDTTACYVTTVSIENISINKIPISLFPNPATTALSITLPQKSQIQILNIQGQLIKTISNAEKETTIDIRDLSSGVYIIKAITEDGMVVRKFVKE